MRFSKVTSIEQVSFKDRNRYKYKKLCLNFGNNGFYIYKNIQFEYAYFFIIQRFLKYLFKFKYSKMEYFKIWVFIRGNYPVSKKSKNSRMGKGKGGFSRWLIKLSHGHVILEFKNVSHLRLKRFNAFWNKFLNFNVYLMYQK